MRVGVLVARGSRGRRAVVQLAARFVMFREEGLEPLQAVCSVLNVPNVRVVGIGRRDGGVTMGRVHVQVCGTVHEPQLLRQHHRKQQRARGPAAHGACGAG